MIIAFYCRGVPCDGHSINQKPLGGTESAMVYMARALAARGHEVFVFHDVEKPGFCDGVFYHSYLDFEAFAESRTVDVFICIRHMLPLLAKRWAALQIYFSPDAYDQPFINRALPLSFQHERESYEIGLYSLAFVQNFVDAIFCVGEWQAKTFIKRFSLLPDRVTIAHNGVCLPDFKEKAQKNSHQLAYCSTPFRGLEHLLRYFPEIRRQVPEARCVVISGMQLYGASNEDNQRQFGTIYQLAHQPGVEMLDPLPKQGLAKVLSESRILAYPNTFAETFCIAALEAQAVGLPIVSSQLAAMQERVAEGVDGYLVAGHPSQESYRKGFIDHVVHLLRDDELWLRQSQMAIRKAERFSYDRLAEEWEAHFHRLLAERNASRPGGKPIWPFVPKKQELEIIVNGYPKRVELTAAILASHYATALEWNGFPQAAEKVRRTNG